MIHFSDKKESIMKFKELYLEFTDLSEYVKSAGLLLLRLILAYTFFAPAMMKWSDIASVAVGSNKWQKTTVLNLVEDRIMSKSVKLDAKVKLT